MYKESSEEILKRMKSYVENDVSTMEGTLLHDTLAPTAYELEDTREDLEEILNKVFIDSAFMNGFEEEVIKRAAEIGIYRKEGIKATGISTFYGAKDTIIQKGTLIQTKNQLQFKTIENATIREIGEVDVKIEAIEIGSRYNVKANTITEMPIQLINITKVTNKSDINSGINIESIEELYKRYKIKVTTPATSGNKYHYKLWALEVPGVGDAKVFPLWDSNGTVKVVIIDSNKHSASKELIDKVFKYIEEQRPIGATVTVVSAKEKSINITAKITLANGFNIGSIQSELSNLLDNYLKEIGFEISYISIARIGNIILNTPGVLDYSNLKINNSTANISLEDEEIPILDNVELEV